MSTPKKPTPGKSKISKKPAVEFEISEEDLDKASGGGGGETMPEGPTMPVIGNAGITRDSLVCGTRGRR
jgi:hypothetical protein